MARGAAGYSGTPLVRKLGLRPDLRVCLLHEPDGFRALLDGIERFDISTSLEGAFDYLHLFTDSRAEAARFETLTGHVAAGGRAAHRVRGRQGVRGRPRLVGAEVPAPPQPPPAITPAPPHAPPRHAAGGRRHADRLPAGLPGRRRPVRSGGRWCGSGARPAGRTRRSGAPPTASYRAPGAAAATRPAARCRAGCCRTARGWPG